MVEHGGIRPFRYGSGQRTSESTITELCDGTLMRNDRAVDQKSTKRRQVSYGNASGTSWSSWASNSYLLDPICQGSIIRYNEDYPNRLLFLNPASTVARDRMYVRISYDNGKTWPNRKTFGIGL